MQLVKYEAACKAIQEAVSTDEILAIHDMSARLKAAAKVAKNKNAEMQMTEVRIRAERRLGEMLKGQPKNTGAAGIGTSAVPEENRTLTPTLSDMGIDKKLSSRAQKIAAIPDGEFEQVLQDHKEQQEILTNTTMEKLVDKGNVHVSNNSGENEWYTPTDIIELAREVMGSIDCDPASCDLANESVKAELIYTKDNCGLVNEWYGNVWINPPYAQPLITEFCEAVVKKYDTEEITQACVLVNNATETKWGQGLLLSASAVCFIQSRIKFIDKEGKPSGSPLQGQMIVYFGENVIDFKDVFISIGAVFSND